MAASEAIRNVVLVGHGSTGKTTLTEHVLFAGGVIPKAETIENGKTVSDSSEEEIARQISIHASLCNVSWNGVKINVLDTPGSADFVGEVISALHAADSALVLVGADTGVQIETIKIWRRLDAVGYPRFVFINKMDKEHADFQRALNDLKEKFKAEFFPLLVPIGAESAYRGVVNLLDQKAYLYTGGGKPKVEDVPADMADMVAEQRIALMEAAAEGSDALMEKYLEEESLSDEEILEGIREAIADAKIVPVLSGASSLHSGVAPLLDFLCSAAPAPFREMTLAGDAGGGSQAIDAGAPLSCQIFKTSIDQFSGKLSYVKTVTGRLAPESDIVNAKNQQKERISKVYTSQGKKLDEVPELVAGDIGVLNKLETAETWDTLCSPDRIVRYEPPKIAQPPHAVAVSAASKKDEDKLNQMLQRETLQDPTFQVTYNNETKETVISSMGELHLAIVLDKIKGKQKIDVETRVPKVAYRETISKPAAAEYQHKKQTGGHGQYARVSLEIRPLARGEHFIFANAVFGGAIPRQYIPGVEKGVVEAMEAGVVAGYPVTDLEAKVVDGKHHPVDSSELSFKLASRGAFRDAMQKANPVLLEPIMNVEIYVEDQYLGDVLSDLSSRRGRVSGQEPIGGGIQLVKAQVPRAELLRYSIDLKSITSGTASFEVEFDHYAPITGKLAEDVIKAAHTEAQGE